ncbi:hypothetical protein EKH79_03345 [Dyella dinghuensis]|uniref:Uncharacterized protein n=1 Tax=Dyella dinghuensis TaxID=1920169 RepID=A0A3S0PD22_9GAMM|nr:hypothetical protein [Dyella dinghuensis]RUL65759.1 hypothetical protein EKH79_03345 [Dyella dinghuensis]
MWLKIPYSADEFLVELALVALAFAYALRRLLRCRLATGLAVSWIVALVCYAGIAPLISSLLIGSSAIGIGSLVVPHTSMRPAPFALLVGLSVITGLVGWTLPLPIHTHSAYLSILIGICVVRWHAIAATMQSWPASWVQAIDVAPGSAALAVMAIGMVSTCAWTPTIHFDDLAYHLGLPYQLQTLGYYRMDAGSQLWAVAPWAGDVIQGIAQLVAKTEARGAVDSMWLTLTLGMLWNLGETLQLSPSARWLMLALYASVPLTADTLTGMQTEGPTAAVAVALAWLIQRDLVPDRRSLMMAGLLGGLLLGLKASNVLIAGPLGLWLLWRWQAHIPWRTVPIAMAAAIVVAGSSYSYGYVLAGNPVLPLFNGYFHSQYYLPINFRDTTYETGLHVWFLWDLIFHTSHYFEGADGSLGFVPLALGGSLLIAITMPRVRPLALVASTAFVLPLTQIQYVRYVQPAMALLLPAMFCGIPSIDLRQHENRAVLTAVALLVLSNLAFVANGSWQLYGGVLKDLWAHGELKVLNSYAPTRRIAAIIREGYGASARTLLVDRRYPYAAELAGTAFVTSWYDNELVQMAWNADVRTDGVQWARVFDRTGANLIVVHQDDYTSALKTALSQARGVRVSTVGDFDLWALHWYQMGVESRASPETVAVTFDTSSAPPGATLVSADLNVRCKTGTTPIEIRWDVTQEDSVHKTRSENISCGLLGAAHSSFEEAVSAKVVGFTITATQSRLVAIPLQVDKATVSLRSDLTAERDLAWHWQRRLLGWVTP